jgi:DNA polymerase-3 subunit delta'
MQVSSHEPPYFWQQKQWRQLMQWRDQDRLPHALLLTGQFGLGQRPFVMKAGRLLLCDHGQDCGQCYSCKRLHGNNHPDWLVVGDREQNDSIKIDDIRQMTHSIHQTTHSGRYKIVVIDTAERMTDSAANALLKTLEEPPPSMVTFIISYAPYFLLPTVRSRCQMLKFTPPMSEDSMNWLRQQGFEVSEQILSLLGDAPLAVIERGSKMAQMQQTLLQCLIELARCELSLDEAASRLDGASQTELIDQCQAIITNAIKMKLNAYDNFVDNRLMQQSLQILYHEVTIERLNYIWGDLAEIKAAMQQGVSHNPQLLIDHLLLSLSAPVFCAKDNL